MAVKRYLIKLIVVGAVVPVLWTAQQSAWGDARGPGSPPGPASGPGEHKGKDLLPPKDPAQGGDLEDQPVGKGKDGWIGGYLQTLLALALVVALIFITRSLIRRYVPGGRIAKRDQALGILARTNVGPGRQLLVVRFGRRLLLLGSGPDGLSNLCEVRDREEADELLNSIAGSGEGAPQFPREKEGARGETSDLEKRR